MEEGDWSRISQRLLTQGLITTITSTLWAPPMSRLKPPTVAEVETEYRYIMRRLFGPHPGEDLFDTDQMYRDVRSTMRARAISRPSLDYMM